LGLPVVAFVDLNLEDQISFFVTINREQKGVSSSLYYDLLQKLPTNRSAVEVIQERAAELAGILRKDSSSPFFGRIKVTTSPKKGELSMTNFIRKVTPHLRDDGRLQIYNDLERAAFLNNLYRALEAAFPKEWKRSDCVFFRTIGFGAIIDTLPVIMDAAFAVAKRNRFRVENVVEALQLIRDFDFDAWRQMGTGNAGEKSAASDLKARLQDEMKEVKGGVVEL
jgi:hypothetical protein